MNRIYGIVALGIAFGAGALVGVGVAGGSDPQQASPPITAHFAVAEGPVGSNLVPAAQIDRPLDFADIIESTVPAVVGIANIRRGGSDGAERFHERLFPWWYFRNPLREPEPEENPFEREERSDTAGSGFFVSEDGYILTNNHVAENPDRLIVTLNDGTQYDAKLIGADPSIDLALIKIEPEGDEKFPALTLGDSEHLRVGEWVIAIGNPLGFEMTVTVGIVSAKDRRVGLPGTDAGVAEFIQTDAAINLGNSGGPLLDAYGRVVGINTAINRTNMAEGIGFALQITEARKAMEQLLETGEVKRGLIGIRMSSRGIDREAQRYLGLPDPKGVLVESVTDGGPADRAGLRRGDVIRQIDGKIIRGNDDLLGEISSRRPGEKVDLLVFRKGKTFETTAKLAERNTAALTADSSAGGEEPESAEPEENGEATGLGLTVETLDPRALSARLQRQTDSDLRGLLVTDVEFGSQAADKGIQPGLVVVAVNDRPVSDVGDWKRILGGIKTGETVKLDLSTLGGDPVDFIFLTVP